MFNCSKSSTNWKKITTSLNLSRVNYLENNKLHFFLNYFFSLIYFQRHNLERVLLHSKSVVNTHSAVQGGELLKDTCNKDVSRNTVLTTLRTASCQSIEVIPFL